MRRALGLILVTVGCAAETAKVVLESASVDAVEVVADLGSSSDAEPVADAASSQPKGLPVLHAPDLAAAARGRTLFETDWPGKGIFPELALRNLYIAWLAPSDFNDVLALYEYVTKSDVYWKAFRERYGFIAREGKGSELPVGFRASKEGTVSVDCLVCHAARIPTGTVVGTGNTRIDLQGLYDELRELPAAVQKLRQKPWPEPYKSLLDAIPVPTEAPTLPFMQDVTGAAGHTDAMGFSMHLAALTAGKDPAQYHTKMGYQDAPAWWTLKYRDRRYWDGSGHTGGYRTMMGTLLGLGLTPAEAGAVEARFGDLEHHLMTLEAPPWPKEYPAPDAAHVEAGRAVFVAECASCHGTYEGTQRGYTDTIIPADDVGTDPLRAKGFGEAEVALVNGLTWDVDHPMTATGGYLAPPLAGVWATAPYFHNGSVPDLRGVLVPAERPARWRRLGEDLAAYDPERVGWRVDAGGDGPTDPKTVEGRRVIDTARPGLSREGHVYGGALTEAQRSALLAYLKML